MTQLNLKTTAQAAERLGYTDVTIRRMVEDGRLRAAQKLHGPNGAYLFEDAELERAAAERIAELTAELKRLTTAQANAVTTAASQ